MYLRSIFSFNSNFQNQKDAKSQAEFQEALGVLIEHIAINYPFHSLYQVGCR
jgi:hypothetical protein